MGICESSGQKQKEQSLKTQEQKLKKIEEEQDNASFRSHPNKIISENERQKKISSFNVPPKISNYERSVEKTEDNLQKTSSSKGEEDVEVIVRGKINKDNVYQAKEFDNASFAKEVKKEGGMFEEMMSNNPQKCDKMSMEMENISEIKSRNSHYYSVNSVRNNQNLINGQKNQINMNRDKYTNYSIQGNRLKILYRDNDIKSHYTNKTSAVKMNLNDYLKGIFNNENVANNNMMYNRNNNLLNVNQRQFFNYNIPQYEKNYLYNNYPALNTESTNDDMMGSIITIPKNDENINEDDLLYAEEDLISCVSSNKN